jgi:chromosome segregation ATPase
LKAQKNAEDESTRTAFGNLRSEVINLRHEAIEKEKIMLSMVSRLKESHAKLAKFSKESSIVTKLEEEKKSDLKHIADLEFALSAQVELHKFEVSSLEEKLDEFSKNLEVEKEKRGIAKTEQSRVRKNVEELRLSKEQSLSVASQCCDKLKNMFANIGAFSNEKSFI